MMIDSLIKIVLIENDERDARYLQEVLSKASTNRFDMIWKNTLKSGIEEINNGDIDVVITDLDLPDSKGLNTLKQLHQNAQDLPILVYSDTYNEEKAITAIRAGAQDCLYKDYINTHRLVNSVKYSMERKAIREQLAKLNKEIEQSYSQLKAQYAHLIQTEKMSTIGTMVAGVAHELNNPLMSIYNFIEFSLITTQKDDERYEYLNIAKEAANRCIEIVKNLATFTRIGDDSEFEILDINAMIESVLKLISYKILKTSVKIYKDIEENVPPIPVIQNNILQVFLNILSNAIDSLVNSERKEIHIKVESLPEFIRILIRDTGCGISPRNLRNIFDPFFTTKPAGEGTGLGLYISKNIIQHHGGKLSCKSKQGVGTEFEILLPLKKPNATTFKEKELLN